MSANRTGDVLATSPSASGQLFSATPFKVDSFYMKRYRVPFVIWHSGKHVKWHHSIYLFTSICLRNRDRFEIWL